jgi:hypothetical protein
LFDGQKGVKHRGFDVNQAKIDACKPCRNFSATSTLISKLKNTKPAPMSRSHSSSSTSSSSASSKSSPDECSDHTRALNRFKEEELRKFLLGGSAGEAALRALLKDGQHQIDKLYVLLKEKGLPTGKWYRN